MSEKQLSSEEVSLNLSKQDQKEQPQIDLMRPTFIMNSNQQPRKFLSSHPLLPHINPNKENEFTIKEEEEELRQDTVKHPIVEVSRAQFVYHIKDE